MKKHYFILLAALLGGFSSLVYELVWTRYLALLLGSSSYALGVVTACYMAGLAIGGFLLGRLTDRHERMGAWLAFGGFGVLCALSLLLYKAVGAVQLGLLRGVPEGDSMLWPRILIAALGLLLPTICIGGMTPVLVRRYRQEKGSTLVYAVFTLGSVLGAVLTGFFLIPALGLGGSGLLGGLGALAALPLLRARTPERTVTEKKAAPLSPYPAAVRRWVAVLYTISGFTAMAYQMYQTKLLTLFFMDSVYDFTLILAVFLVGLFLGNCLGDYLAVRSTHDLFYLGLGQAAIGLLSIASLFFTSLLPYWTEAFSPLAVQSGGSFASSLLIKSAYAALVILPPALMWGSVFPLASKAFLRGSDALAARTGLLTGWNAVGSALGSLLGSFLLIELLGLRGGILFGAGMNLAAACIFAVAGKNPLSRRQLTGMCCLGLTAALCVALLPPWNRFEMSTSFLKPGQDVTGAVDMLYYKEDAYGITSVAHFLPYDQKYLTTNRLYCQNTADLGGAEDHRRLGYIPMLLHSDPKDVLVAGLGSGITLRGVVEYGETNIDCVEISRSVSEAARFFSEENGGALDKENVRLIIEDARNYMLRTQKQYDVIIGDIFFPMSSGSSSLFSREYYESARARLQEGGLMVQWIPLHQFSPDELQLTANTFSSVFPNSYYMLGMIGSSVPVVGLVGCEEDLSISLDALESLYESRPALSAELANTALDDSYMLLSHYIGKITKNSNDIVTDDRPILEYLNPKVKSSYLSRGQENLEWLMSQKSPAQELVPDASEAQKDMLSEYDLMIEEFISANVLNSPES